MAIASLLHRRRLVEAFRLPVSLSIRRSRKEALRRRHIRRQLDAGTGGCGTQDSGIFHPFVLAVDLTA